MFSITKIHIFCILIQFYNFVKLYWDNNELPSTMKSVGESSNASNFSNVAYENEAKLIKIVKRTYLHVCVSFSPFKNIIYYIYPQYLYEYVFIRNYEDLRSCFLHKIPSTKLEIEFTICLVHNED